MYHDVRLSLMGLYNYDETLFDLMVVPNGIERETVVNNILMECAELCAIYPNATIMKNAIGEWSKTMVFDWGKMYDALHMEYEVLWNKDANETWTETRSLQSDENKHDMQTTTNVDNHENTITDSTTEEQSGDQTTTKKVTGYNQNTFTNSEQETIEQSSNKTTLGNQRVEGSEDGTENIDATGETNRNENETITHEHRSFGNIGVTSAEQLITQEVEMRLKYNLYKIIINDFKRRFCMLIY